MTAPPRNSEESPTAGRGAACACGLWWRLPLLLGLVLAAILLAKGRGVREDASESAGPAATDQASATAAGAISLTIDFGDGREQQSDAIPWTAGMTVRDLLNTALGLSISQQGSGSSAFLAKIDNVANEGSGGRNWMYSVNGQRADRSFAVYELQAGDHVLWSFEPPQ